MATLVAKRVATLGKTWLVLPALYAYSPHRLQAYRFSNWLDTNLLSEDNGHDPEKIRELLRRRFNRVDLADQVIELDKQWRQRKYELDNLRKEFKEINKTVNMKNTKQNAFEMITQTKENKKAISQKETEVQEAKSALDSRLGLIGNLVDDSVLSDDADNISIVHTEGECRKEPNLMYHAELAQLLEIVNLEKGADIAGHRGYFLKGDGVLLNEALINFAVAFLLKRGYDLLGTPVFMREEIMAKCAQLAQFDEDLYKVIGDGDDMYLIATSEQPMCAYLYEEWVDPTTLPRRYAGYSPCFRKEAGSHGKDTLGIFRVHHFEKVEQFCVTSPNGNKSWDMHEEMIKITEDFYKTLNIPYRIVSIDSGASNAACAKKYDLEGWFPASQTYRELVSCSNCTDYQSRKLEIRYGQKKSNEEPQQYVHLLNSTLTATERTICCILENYQREDGVEIPKALRPYMLGIDFLPFVNAPAMNSKPKKAKPKV